MESHMLFQLDTGHSRHNRGSSYYGENAVVVLGDRCRPESAGRRGVERGHGHDGQLQRHQPLRHRDIPLRLQGKQTGKRGKTAISYVKLELNRNNRCRCQI